MFGNKTHFMYFAKHCQWPLLKCLSIRLVIIIANDSMTPDPKRLCWAAFELTVCSSNLVLESLPVSPIKSMTVHVVVGAFRNSVKYRQKFVGKND
jgi:hypothetical protein